MKEKFIFVSILVFTMTGIILNACSGVQDPGNNETQGTFFYQPPHNDPGWLTIFTIVRFEQGHKIPGPPPRDCSNTSHRVCWRWFPWINNAYEVLYTDPIAACRYNKETKDMILSLEIPTFEEENPNDYFLYDIVNQDSWYISDTIFIDDHRDLLLLEESRCISIPSGYYQVEDGQHTTIKGACNDCGTEGITGKDITLPTNYEHAFYMYVTPCDIGLSKYATWNDGRLHVVGIVDEFENYISIKIYEEFNDGFHYEQMRYFQDIQIEEPIVITDPEITELFSTDTLWIPSDYYYLEENDSFLQLTIPIITN